MVNPDELAKGPISAKRPPGWQPGQVGPTGYKRDIGLGWMQPTPLTANPGDWLHALGNVLGMAGTGLDWWNENVPKRALGEIVGHGEIAPKLLGPGVGAMLSDAASKPDVQEVYRREGPQAAWEYAASRYLPLGGVGQFVAESLADPTSYIGFGLPGKAAGVAAKAGPAGKVVARGLEGAQAVDTVLSRAMGAPIEGALKVGGDVLGKLPAFQLSKQGQLSQFGDALKDAVTEAQGLGYRYRGIQTKAPEIGAWPGQGKTNAVENQAWRNLEDTISAIKEPLARFRAFMAKEYANMNAGQWGADAAGEAALARSEGRLGDITDIWQTRHRKVMQLVDSLGKTVKQFGAETPITTTPEQSQAAEKVANDAISTVRNLTAQTRQAVEGVKNRFGQGTNEYASEADKLFRQRNEQIRGIIQDAQSALEDVYFPGGGTFPETGVMRDLQGKLSELQSLTEGLPSFFGKMSDERAGTLQNLLPSFDRYAKFVDRDRNKVSRIINDIQKRAPGLSVEDVQDSTHLLERVKNAAQPYEYNTLRNTLERWTKEGMDLLQDDELNLVQHRIVMDKRNQLGIKGDGPIAGALRTPMRAWAEQALLSPRYHLQNVASILGMGQLGGVGAGGIARNIGESLRNLGEEGVARYPSVVRKALTDWEQPDTPRAIADSFASSLGEKPLVEGQRVAQSAMSKIPAAIRVGGGILAGSPAGPVGMAFGGLLGAFAPTLVKANKKLGSAIEFAARSTAWMTGKEQHVQKEMPGFLSWLAQEMRTVKPRVADSGLGTAVSTQRTESGVEQAVNVGKGSWQDTVRQLQEAAQQQAASLPGQVKQLPPGQIATKAKEYDISWLLDQYKAAMERLDVVQTKLDEAHALLDMYKEGKGFARPTKGALRFWSDDDLIKLAKEHGVDWTKPDWEYQLDPIKIRDARITRGRTIGRTQQIANAKNDIKNLSQEETQLLAESQKLEGQMTDILGGNAPEFPAKRPRGRGPGPSGPTIEMPGNVQQPVPPSHQLNEPVKQVSGEYIPPQGKGGNGFRVEAKVDYEVPHSSKQIADTLNEIRSTDGRIGASRLMRILSNHDVNMDVANQAVKRWQNILQQGDVTGEKLAAKINFDYAKTDNFEEMMRGIAPFIVWPKRAMPFFAQALAEHPGLILALAKYNSLSEQDTKNLPRQYQGMANTGRLGETVARRIFGREGKVFTNPIEMFMPFANIQEPSDKSGSTLGGQVRNLLGDVGLGLAPWVDIPATVAGVYGNRSMPRILRHSGLLQALTGTDVENAWREPAANAQQMLTGSAAPVDWFDYLVRRRILEKSVEETGKTQAPEYVRAIENKSSPIYQQAAKDVKRQTAAGNTLGFVSPAQLRMLPATEELAAQDRSALPKPRRDEHGNIVVNGQVWADKEAAQQQRTDLQQHPLAETYGKIVAPTSAPLLFSKVVGYTLAQGGAAKQRWRTQIDTNGLGFQYLMWWKDKGHNVDKGDVGTLEDVKRFIMERGG